MCINVQSERSHLIFLCERKDRYDEGDVGGGNQVEKGEEERLFQRDGVLLVQPVDVDAVEDVGDRRLGRRRRRRAAARPVRHDGGGGRRRRRDPARRRARRPVINCIGDIAEKN